MSDNNFTQTSLATMFGVLGAAGVLTVVIAIASGIKTHQDNVNRAENMCAGLKLADPNSNYSECVERYTW